MTAPWRSCARVAGEGDTAPGLMRELALDDGRELLRLRQLFPRELARLGVDQGQSADPLALRAVERHAGVEAQMKLAGDERIVGESGILGGVRHNHGSRLEH